MKKSFKTLAILTFIPALVFTSCGPSKELLDSKATVSRLEKNIVTTSTKLDECNAHVQYLDDVKLSLDKEFALIQNDMKVLTKESKLTIADQAKRLKNLQTMIQMQKDVMTKLKNSIADALMNFKADEVYVDIKDGNVYVSLEEKLLFKSGSDVIDPKGKEALKILAEVLNNTKGITVMIEGHTDNVPIKTNLFKDNWDLSTARAISIVRILTKEYGFNSDNIIASGRGKFHPVKTNETADGRAGNRRTEVILSPDLKELYNILNQ